MYSVLGTRCYTYATSPCRISRRLRVSSLRQCSRRAFQGRCFRFPHSHPHIDPVGGKLPRYRLDWAMTTDLVSPSRDSTPRHPSHTIYHQPFTSQSSTTTGYNNEALSPAPPRAPLVRHRQPDSRPRRDRRMGRGQARRR